MTLLSLFISSAPSADPLTDATLCALALVAFFFSVLLTPGVRFVAGRRNWIDFPKKDRWHAKPTALMGGIAIYLSAAVPLLFMADFGSFLSAPFKISPDRPLPSVDAVIWFGMTFMFILGLIDDRIHIKPHTKLLGQFLVASFVAFMGFRLEWFTSMTFDTIVTIVWIVGVTNAFNLIDNMDGLCAGVAMIAAVYFALLFSAGSVPGGLLPSVLLAGALAGFLFYNFNPASIFMGDCGSLMIGFTLAMLGIYYSETGNGTVLAARAVPIMVLLVPILDTTMVTFIRLLSGRKASAGGRDHTSHRLVLMGFSERAAVLFLYGVGAISGVSALFVSTTDSLTSPAVIIPLAVAVLLMGIFLAQIRVYPEREFCLLRDQVYTPILIELTYKRQLVFVLLDFCLIAFSYYLSYRLRYDYGAFVQYFKIFLHSLPVIISCKFVAFFLTGMYRGFWQYMSTDDVFAYLKSTTGATLLSLAFMAALYGFHDFSISIFVIDWLLTTGLILGTRGSFRISQDAMKRNTLSGEKVLIYGAGRGGEILLRELTHNAKHKIVPIGFIDDDPIKTGKKLQGYPILGTFQDIDRLLAKHDFKGVLISFNGVVPNNVQGARQFCRSRNLFLKRFSINLNEVDN